MKWNELVRALVKSGLTQQQIAREAGCGQATISDLITGKTKEPRGSMALTLIALCASRGLSVDGFAAAGDVAHARRAAPQEAA